LNEVHLTADFIKKFKFCDKNFRQIRINGYAE